MAVVRIKDLPNDTDLVGLKVKTSKGVIGYVYSMTEDRSMVFLNNLQGELRYQGRLYPQILLHPDRIMQWEVIQDESIPCNCHIKTDIRYTSND